MPGRSTTVLFDDHHKSADSYSKIFVEVPVGKNRPRPEKVELPPLRRALTPQPRPPGSAAPYAAPYGPSTPHGGLVRRMRRRMNGKFLMRWSDKLNQIKMKAKVPWWKFWKTKGPAFPIRSCDPGEIYQLRRQLRALQASFPTSSCSARFRAVDQLLQTTLTEHARIKPGWFRKSKIKWRPKCSNGYWIAEDLKALAGLGNCMKKAIDTSPFIRTEDLNAVNQELRLLRWQAETTLQYPKKKEYKPPPNVRMKRPDRDKLLAYIYPKIRSISGSALLVQVLTDRPMRCHFDFGRPRRSSSFL